MKTQPREDVRAQGFGFRRIEERQDAIAVAQTHHRIQKVKGAFDIPFRALRLNDLSLGQTSLELVRELPDLDSGRLRNDRAHLEMLLPAFGVSILGEAPAKVLGFPDVDQLTLRIMDHVDPGGGGQLRDELVSELFVECLHRLMIRHLHVGCQKSGSARDMALIRLNVREYSAGEMRMYLKRKGYELSEIDPVVRNSSRTG